MISLRREGEILLVAIDQERYFFAISLDEWDLTTFRISGKTRDKEIGQEGRILGTFVC